MDCQAVHKGRIAFFLLKPDKLKNPSMTLCKFNSSMLKWVQTKLLQSWKPVSERVFSTTDIRFYVNHSLLGMSKKI